jgi:protein-tyrosine kinase
MADEAPTLVQTVDGRSEQKTVIGDMAEFSLKTQEELAAQKIIYPGMRQREVLTAFRDLRTKLLAKAGKDNFSLLVSTVSHGSGSSFVSVNMAASIAIDERKTAVYVDCNIEDSYANKLLHEPPEHGLMEYLENPGLDIKDIIYSSGIPRLRVVPAGVSNERSVEALASPRMADFVRDLKLRYPDRFVILDVPPVSESSVARILAPMVDMAVLVVPFGKVTTEQILSGVDAVGKERFAGLVFNNE